MFEIKHLKTLITLANTGNIRKAAQALFTSQSALSHQIKELEQRLGTRLFIRNTVPVEFTQSGEVLLSLAKDILPNIIQANMVLKAKQQQEKTLHIAIACHACFQWLLPISDIFKQQHQAINIEFIDPTFTSSQPVISDILFTDECHDDGFIYQEIGQFEVVAVVAKQQKNCLLTSTVSKIITPQEFSKLTLLTYPLPSKQLDVFTLFLDLVGVQPAQTKQVSNSHVMLQMVAANMGVAALPDWLVTSLTLQSLVESRRLGEHGVFKSLYARYQQNSTLSSEIEAFIPLTINAFNAMYADNKQADG